MSCLKIYDFIRGQEAVLPVIAGPAEATREDGLSLATLLHPDHDACELMRGHARLLNELAAAR